LWCHNNMCTGMHHLWVVMLNRHYHLIIYPTRKKYTHTDRPKPIHPSPTPLSRGVKTPLGTARCDPYFRVFTAFKKAMRNQTRYVSLSCRVSFHFIC
jgi:hypothetical protein